MALQITRECGCNKCCGCWNLAPFFNKSDRHCPGICPDTIQNARPNMICLVAELTWTPTPGQEYFFQSLPNPIPMKFYSNCPNYFTSGWPYNTPDVTTQPGHPEGNSAGYAYPYWPPYLGNVLLAKYDTHRGYFYQTDVGNGRIYSGLPHINFGGTIPAFWAAGSSKPPADQSGYTCKADLANLELLAPVANDGYSGSRESVFYGAKVLDGATPFAGGATGPSQGWALESSNCSPFELRYTGGKIFTCVPGNYTTPDTSLGTFTVSIKLTDCINRKKFFWWCVNQNIKQSATPIAGATGGPYATYRDAVESGCNFGTPNPTTYYSATDGKTVWVPCKPSATRPNKPGSATGWPLLQSGTVLGPFANEGDCIDFSSPYLWWAHRWSPTVQQSSLMLPNHSGPYLSRWDAHTQAHGTRNPNDGSLTDSCKVPAPPPPCWACKPDGTVALMTESEARKTLCKIFWDQSQALEYCKPFTPPIAAPGGKKWWCTNYLPVESVDPPNGSTAGPFDTLAECQAVCAFRGTGNGMSWEYWYCVDGVVRQYDNMPTGASSGPYATKAEADAKCGKPDEPPVIVPGQPPPQAPPPPDSTVQIQTRNVQIQTRAAGPLGNQERFWLPCVHKGPEIPGSGFT